MPALASLASRVAMQGRTCGIPWHDFYCNQTCKNTTTQNAYHVRDNLNGLIKRMEVVNSKELRRICGLLNRFMLSTSTPYLVMKWPVHFESKKKKLDAQNVCDEILPHF